MSEQFENEIERFCALFSLELPHSLLQEIVVLFADGDSKNWSVENLGYCFKNGPLECPFYSGYFYIPGFCRYVINLDGDSRVVKTGHLKKWGTTPGNVKKNITGGYRVTSANGDLNTVKSMSRHRALCLAFKHPGVHVGKLWVNHINGIPGSDNLANLEFCTPGHNVKHAYDNGLHNNKLSPVSLLNWITGQSHEFSTATKCVEFLGKSGGLVSGRLRAGNHRRYSDGWRIKLREDTWKELDKYENHAEPNVEIICRNIFTGESCIFGSMSEAARFTRVAFGAIQANLETESMLPMAGWNFARFKEFEGWPTYTEKHLAIFKEYPRNPVDGIEVYDCDTNTTEFFVDAKKAAMHFGLSPITVSKLARYEQTRQKRFIFKLFRIRETVTGPTFE